MFMYRKSWQDYSYGEVHSVNFISCMLQWPYVMIVILYYVSGLIIILCGTVLMTITNVVII